MPRDPQNFLETEFQRRASRGAKAAVALLRAGAAVTSRIAPGWTAERALDHFLTPPRSRRPERERRWLANARESTLRVEGRAMRCWSWEPPFSDQAATAPVILLMHGWAGRGAQLGAFAEPLVEAGFRVVTLDALGHGDSEGATSSFPELAAALTTAAGAFGPLHAVVAHSAGAVITTYAVPRGLAVERLVYLSAPHDPARFPWLFGDFLGLTPAAVEMMVAKLERRVGVRVAEFYGPALAASMTVPLLAFHDRDDPEVSPESAEALVEAWPGARLIHTSGLGHHRILRDPKVIEEALRFLTAPAIEETPAAVLATF